MKTALISGARGFVARHLRPILEEAGYAVSGFDIKTGTDARDLFRTSNDSCDVLFHLAAVVGGRAKIEGAPLDLAIDLAIDAEMFQWALRTRPGKVVYFSSSAAYPTRLQDLYGYVGPGASRHDALFPRPLKEGDITLSAVEQPDAVYGWVKLTGEMQAAEARKLGLNVLVVRPFSGYGPTQDLDYPFPSFIARALRKDDPFEIWGDGTQIRDFIHMDDVCRATLAAVEQGIEGPINLGTGRGTSFNDLARMVTTIAGYSPEFKHILDAPVGVHTRVADPTRMLEFYRPKFSLEQGIAESLLKL